MLLSLGVERDAIARLAAVSAGFYQRGWAFGTSGNYSLVQSRVPLRLLITASGRDKASLNQNDFTLVADNGKNVVHGLPEPSAETLLHTTLAEHAGAGAILHTHSVWGTLLSDYHARHGGFAIEGYEMLKGLDGIRSHDTRKWLEIFDNTQDIPTLAEIIRTRIIDPANPLQHGFLIRNHGLYAWGRGLSEAQRHIEIFEFLFEVLGRKLSLPKFGE